jgi:hypothetical protein
MDDVATSSVMLHRLRITRLYQPDEERCLSALECLLGDSGQKGSGLAPYSLAASEEKKDETLSADLSSHL